MIFHEEHMRTGDDSTSATLCGEGGRHPLAAGCWFITNKDYPGNGTFCPLFDCCSVRTSRALTHAFASLVERWCSKGVRRWPKIACQDFGDAALRRREISRGQICRHVRIYDGDTDRPRGCSRVVMSS